MPDYPVFVKPGDAQDEVDALVRELSGPSAAGLHKTLYVTRAAQTVVMVTGREVPLARRLRERDGWEEPDEDR